MLRFGIRYDMNRNAKSYVYVSLHTCANRDGRLRTMEVSKLKKKNLCKNVHNGSPVGHMRGSYVLKLGTVNDFNAEIRRHFFVFSSTAVFSSQLYRTEKCCVLCLDTDFSFLLSHGQKLHRTSFVDHRLACKILLGALSPTQV